jgi:hypothetical protein
MKSKRQSRKKFIAQVNADVAKIQADALTSQMIAEALCWKFELTPEQIGQTVRMFLDWKEFGSPVLQAPVSEPVIEGVTCPALV